MIIASTLSAQRTIDRLGFIPSFLDIDDPRPAAQQFNERYAHGGGWRPLEGFKRLDRWTFQFPGDAPMRAFAMTQFHTEEILFLDYAYVVIVQEDGSFEISRMD